MGAYTAYDFRESLDKAGVTREEIAHVLAAWGDSAEGYGQWEGGFLIEFTFDAWLKRLNTYAYIWGWCDTTGWGCQDGGGVELFDEVPELNSLTKDYMDVAVQREWDPYPADLNLWLDSGKDYP